MAPRCYNEPHEPTANPAVVPSVHVPPSSPSAANADEMPSCDPSWKLGRFFAMPFSLPSNDRVRATGTSVLAGRSLVYAGSSHPEKGTVMQFQPMPLRNDDLAPTQPAFQVDDKKALTVGAWAGVCFALAIISAAAVILISEPDAQKNPERADAPPTALPSPN